MNEENLMNRVIRVIGSCKTVEQLDVALKYAHLADKQRILKLFSREMINSEIREKLDELKRI